MATLTEKISLIDKVNTEFEGTQSKFKNHDYDVYFSKLNTKIETLILSKTNVKSKDITKVVNSVKIPNTSIRHTVHTGVILSGITNVIENQQLDKDDKENFLPIIAFLGLYSLGNIKLLNDKANKITKAVLSNNSKNLSPKEVKGFKMIKGYFKINRDVISKEIVSFEKNLVRINKDIRSTTSKKIFKDYRRLRNTKITQEQVSEQLLGKFGKENKSRIARISRTQVKSQNELIKQTQHSLNGYTHKRWNTQGDAKVSLSHKAMSGKIVKIGKKFRVPGIDRKPGASLMYPGDPSGPVGQIVNERCFLTYLKRK